MKVIIITQHYPPDLGASAFRLQALTNELLKRNHEVTVLTATPNRYSSLKITEDLSTKENVVRIPVQTGKDSAPAQIGRQISFYLKMRKTAKKLCKENVFDIAIASSPPFLIGMAGTSMKKYVKKLIVEIRDLWPDTVVDLGKARESNPIIKIMRHYETKMYRTADKVVTVAPFANDVISSRGISSDKLITFTNGLDRYLMEEIESWSLKKREARDRLNIPEEKFIVTYVGNIGLGQKLETLVDSAKKLRDIDFLMVGDGSDKSRLQAMAEGLDNIHFIPPVPRDRVPMYYSASDILFIHLADAKLFKNILPSKIFEYAAANRPIVYGLDGLSSEILDNCHSGIKIHKNNAEEVAAAITEIRKKFEFYELESSYGKKYILENFLRETIMKNYVDFLEDLFLN